MTEPTFRSKISMAGEFIRATTFTELGSSTKTCQTHAEAEAFINLVKAKRTLVPRKKEKSP